MTVAIRLTRVGTKKKVKHRIVVADSRSPRDGRFIEILGYWNPNTNPETLKIDTDKASDWLKQGAQPTETVKSILKRAGIKSSN